MNTWAICKLFTACSRCAQACNYSWWIDKFWPPWSAEPGGDNNKSKKVLIWKKLNIRPPDPLLLLATVSDRKGYCRSMPADGGWEESPWILSEQPHPLRRSTSLPSSPQVSTEPLTAPHCFTINHRKATEKPYWGDKEHGLHSICFLWTHLFQWAIVGRLNAFFRPPCRLKLPAMSLLPKQMFHVDELG